MDDAALELVRSMLLQQAAVLELYARQWSDTPEDVVQEALLRLAEQRPLPDRPVAWMYVAVRRGAISAARSRARRRQHEAAAATSDEWFAPSIDDAIDGRLATAALAGLPLEQREVLVARIWGRLSFQEIAEVVGASSSAVHRRYHAGLEALRTRLNSPCPTTNSQKS